MGALLPRHSNLHNNHITKHHDICFRYSGVYVRGGVTVSYRVVLLLVVLAGSTPGKPGGALGLGRVGLGLEVECVCGHHHGEDEDLYFERFISAKTDYKPSCP